MFATDMDGIRITAGRAREIHQQQIYCQTSEQHFVFFCGRITVSWTTYMPMLSSAYLMFGYEVWTLSKRPSVLESSTSYIV